MSLNFGQIPPLTTELTALECLKNYFPQVSTAIFLILIFLMIADIKAEQAPRFYFFHAQLIDQLSIKLKYRQMKKLLALSLSDRVFIMRINVKIPTIVGILIFMSRINFVLS